MFRIEHSSYSIEKRWRPAQLQHPEDLPAGLVDLPTSLQKQHGWAIIKCSRLTVFRKMGDLLVKILSTVYSIVDKYGPPFVNVSDNSIEIFTKLSAK